MASLSAGSSGLLDTAQSGSDMTRKERGRVQDVRLYARRFVALRQLKEQ